jgi:hypothetical protein
MLHHNTSARVAGRRAHLAHAALIGLHTLCCGMPILALAAVALSGTASGLALFASSAERFHALLHAHEIWILGASAGLVTLGGLFEAGARREESSARGFPWLFALSAACFALNVAIIISHRGA